MPKKLGHIIVAELKKRSEKALNYARNKLSEEKIEDPKLKKALNHYLKHWNDFTHPGLFSMACEAVRGNPDNIIPAQAAIAIIAAAFDIHDDVIDRSTTKHNIPTIYGKFGTERALLLGDAFLIHGLKLFNEAAEILPKEKQRMALEKLKQLIFEVGNAHSWEISLRETRSRDPENYLQVIQKKAASIELDFHMGALFGNGNENDVTKLAELGRIIGILLLLREDFIDIFEIEEISQRLSVKDFPIPLLFALKDQKIRKKLEKIISKPKITQEDVDNLIEYSLKCSSIIPLKEYMLNLKEEGLKTILKISNKKYEKKLKVLLSFFFEDLF